MHRYLRQQGKCDVFIYRLSGLPVKNVLREVLRNGKKLYISHQPTTGQSSTKHPNNWMIPKLRFRKSLPNISLPFRDHTNFYECTRCFDCFWIITWTLICCFYSSCKETSVLLPQLFISHVPKIWCSSKKLRDFYILFKIF